MINETGCVAHYARLENVANILHDKNLRLSKACGFADPRESSMNWISIAGMGCDPEYADKQHAAKNIKYKAGHQIQLLCTVGPKSQASQIETKIYGRPRMWAQYGDAFRGFCVVLNREALNREFESLKDKACSDLMISDNVEYNKFIPLIDSSCIIEHGPGLDPRESEPLQLINENDMIKSVYFKKFIDWKEESEYRWLIYVPTGMWTYISIENVIESVVLGSEFPHNQVDQVKRYCRSLGCSCYQLTYGPSNYDLIPLLSKAP